MIQTTFDFDAKPHVTALPWVFELTDGRRVEAMILGGRLANQFCAGAGDRWHAVLTGRHPVPALCGTKPGRRSMGWFPPQPLDRGDHDKDVTINCPRCLSKLKKLNV